MAPGPARSLGNRAATRRTAALLFGWAAAGVAATRLIGNGTVRSQGTEGSEGSPEGPEQAALDHALSAAASTGDGEAVETLLAQGASVHAADARGVTALIAAAYTDRVEVARRLIHAGADVNRKDTTQQSAYLIPTADGFLELLQLTLENGADVRAKDSYNGTGLIRAADRGHHEIIAVLLRTQLVEEVDHVNRLGWTALLEAIILGSGGPRHTECVRLLLEAGARPNLADGRGVTPLTHARQRGFSPMIALLRAAGGR